MTMRLSDIKSGRPTAFVVTYRGPDIEYVGKDFWTTVHDASPITESKEAIIGTSSPAPRGLERAIVLVNQIRVKNEDPKMTSVDFDTQPALLEGKIPKRIRPELEEYIKRTAPAYGIVLTNVRFLYPQGE